MRLKFNKVDKTSMQILKWDNNHFLCTLCGGHFHKKEAYSFNRCKECVKFERKCHYLENKETTLKQIKKYHKTKKGKKSLKKATQKYYCKNKHKIYNNINKNLKNRRKKDFMFKLTGNLRNRLGQYLKLKKWNKKTNFSKYVGCSFSELKTHLEKQFQPGMTWENYGLFGWHIDHIIPLSSAKTEEEIFKLCHYTNLQPLWAKDNLSKASKLTKFK